MHSVDKKTENNTVEFVATVIFLLVFVKELR